MKVLGAAVLILLCTRTLCSSQEGKTYIIPTCCMSYVSQRIPRKLVVAYFKTNGQCSKHGVVFLTKKGRQICANPSDAWVQEYINNMEEALQAVQ